MKYLYNNSITLNQNILELEQYGEFNTVSEEKEIRIYLASKGLIEDEIERLIIAYLRGLARSN